MGANLVNAASVDAINNINKPTEEIKKPDTPNHNMSQSSATTTQTPPPECPMHAQNKNPNPGIGECPITGDKGEINMLNMVS